MFLIKGVVSIPYWKCASQTQMHIFLPGPNFFLRWATIFFSPPKCRKNQSPEVLLMIFCSIMFFSLSQHQSESDFLKNNASVARTWRPPKTIQQYSEGTNLILWIISRTTFCDFLFQKVFLPLPTPIQNGISRIVNYLVDYNWSFSIQQRLVWAQIDGILLFLDKSPSGKVK